ncbi:MAG: DUF2163 domain-containing protein [Pseudomonadota bacterium]
MKSASANLLAMLNGTDTSHVMADLYTLTLLGGTVLRYTNFDVDLTANGVVYAANSLKFRRDRVRWIAGLEVDTLGVTVHAGPSDLLNGVSFLAQVERGALDGASVKLERAFMQPGSTQAETIHLFSGRVADISAGRTEAQLTVKSDLELLNIMMPRNVYQAGCMWNVFDVNCTLNKAAYVQIGTVSGAANKLWMQSNLTAAAAGHFNLGTLKFTTGANAGITRSVRVSSGGAFTLMRPLPNAPAVGDQFLAYPGCNRTMETCKAKFNNLTNFRGFPFIPAPETAI